MMLTVNRGESDFFFFESNSAIYAITKVFSLRVVLCVKQILKFYSDFISYSMFFGCYLSRIRPYLLLEQHIAKLVGLKFFFRPEQ